MTYQRFDKNGLAGKEVRHAPPCILYRDAQMDAAEKQAMERHFASVPSRMQIHGGDLVIGRYSVLPFYKELEEDLAYKGAKLINSHRQHRYVADLQNYVNDLYGMTFRTWNFRDIQEVPDNIPLVLKGETNSRKEKWLTHMFAENKQQAIQVYLNLSNDSLISEQEVYIREYTPLVQLAEGIAGQPVTMEFRFFVAYGEVLSGGFYWSTFVDELKNVPNPNMVPRGFLQEAIDRVKENVNFFAIDVALTQSGNWIVVELNDGQMSGLSENDPNVLYKNLKTITWDRYQTK